MPVGLNENPVGFVDPACPLDWSHPLNRGLVGCWSTLPNSGWSGGLKLRDISGKGNHCTLTNFASPFTATSGWVPGYTQGRKSLAFDEDNDYVQGSNPLLNFTGTGLTVSVWFYKRASQTTKSHLWDAGSESVNGYCCYIRPDGNNIEAYVGNGSSADVVVSSTLPTTGRWTLVTVTRNSSLISLYYNGKLVTTGATSGNISSTNSNLRWGLRQDANPLTALIGNLEDPRVYNRCLTAAEVRNLYQEQLRGSPETLRWVGAASYGLSSQAAPATGNLFRYSNLSGLQGGGPFFVNPLGA